MNKQTRYPAKNCFQIRAKAQASIEFSLAVILAVLFLFLSTNLFVWFNYSIVKRQRGYEDSRTSATSNTTPGKLDFYAPKTMSLWVSGGYE